MSDKRKQPKPEDAGAERGLGHVVYGDAERREPPEERAEDAAVVTEASEESFPASDPPNYTVGNPNRATSPDSAT